MASQKADDGSFPLMPRYTSSVMTFCLYNISCLSQKLIKFWRICLKFKSYAGRGRVSEKSSTSCSSATSSAFQIAFGSSGMICPMGRLFSSPKDDVRENFGFFELYLTWIYTNLAYYRCWGDPQMF